MIANTYYKIQIKRGKNFWIQLSLIASMNMTTDIGDPRMLQDNYELVVDSNTDVSTSILCNTYTDSICVWEFVQQY
jgi:hypothetical protein